MKRQQTRLTKRLTAWLRSEQSGEERRAERDLRRAFRLLPEPASRVDIVAATMERLGAVTSLESAKAPGGVYKALVAGCLTAASVALAVVPPVVAPWLISVRPSWIVDWWTTLLVGTSQRLASGLTVWKVLQDVGETLAAALASPASITALAFAVILSFVTFRALSGLVSLERRAGNV